MSVTEPNPQQHSPLDSPTNPHRTGSFSFVRRGGRMRASEQQGWEDLQPKYLIDAPRGDGETSIAEGAQLSLSEIFSRKAPLIVEIGTGKGEAILHAAQTHPDHDFIGIDVYREGLAKTMIRANKLGIHNLRLVEANAPEVLDGFLPPDSVSELRIFFPDPWHKARHNKRRLISPSFMPVISRALQPSGVVRLATDWEEYAEQMREVFDASERFERCFAGDWAERFDGRPLTSFEHKGEQAGRQIRDLCYRRVG